MFKRQPEGVGTVQDGSLMEPDVTVMSSASSPPYRRRLITGSIIAVLASASCSRITGQEDKFATAVAACGQVGLKKY